MLAWSSLPVVRAGLCSSCLVLPILQLVHRLCSTTISWLWRVRSARGGAASLEPWSEPQTCDDDA